MRYAKYSFYVFFEKFQVLNELLSQNMTHIQNYQTGPDLQRDIET